MVNRFNRLLTIILIVSLSLYIVILNRDSITVFVTPEKTVTTTIGVFLIAVYVIGILSATLVALFFGMKSYLREKRLEKQDKRRQLFYREMTEARTFSATEDWLKARELWERAIRKDPTNTIGRVELSRCLQGMGETREALKVLDDARAADPTNVEVLFRAAELNVALDNKTAALDNLSLILLNHPNRRAAALARDLSESLDRIEDAMEYQSRLESLGGNEDSSLIRRRLGFRKILRDCRNDTEALENELKVFLKKNPDYAPALQRSAQIAAESGRSSEAAELLLRAAKTTGSPEYWYEAAQLWMRESQPDRALSAARAATNATTGQSRVNAELNLIRTYLALNMYEDAKKACDNFETLLQELAIRPSQDLMQQFLILRGFCLNRMGLYPEAAQVWKKLSNQEFELPAQERKMLLLGHAPSPSLSTP